MLSSLFGNKGKQKDGKLKSIQLAAAAAKKVNHGINAHALCPRCHLLT